MPAYLKNMLLCQLLLISFSGLAQDYNVAIDHVPIAVRDLTLAEATFASLGFTPKEGRVHQNGLVNSFFKFEDGSYLELITPSKGIQDPLTEFYSTFLNKHEGGAAVFLRSAALNQQLELLSKKGFSLHKNGNPNVFTIASFTDQAYGWLLFIEYHSASTDSPAQTSHRNGVIGIDRIHLSEDKFRLLIPVFANHPSFASDEKGSRPVSGITLKVKDLEACKAVIEKSLDFELPIRHQSGTKSICVPAAYAHGVWLEFVELR